MLTNLRIAMNAAKRIEVFSVDCGGECSEKLFTAKNCKSYENSSLNLPNTYTAEDFAKKDKYSGDCVESGQKNSLVKSQNQQNIQSFAA